MRLRRLAGACPKCNTYRCRHVDMPADFPIRDQATGLWVVPTTGEVVNPPPPADEPPQQLELPDDAQLTVRSYIARLRDDAGRRWQDRAPRSDAERRAHRARRQPMG
jgi:hypothetical protein